MANWFESRVKNVFFSFRSVSFIKNIYFVSVFSFCSKKNIVPFRFVSWKITFRFCKIIFCMYKSRPNHTKTKWRFYFLFILVRTTTKSIKFIKKTSVFVLIYSMCCFAFISKAATTKMDFQNLVHKNRFLITEQKNVCYCQHTEKKRTVEFQKYVKVLTKKLHSKKTQTLNCWTFFLSKNDIFLWWIGQSGWVVDPNNASLIRFEGQAELGLFPGKNIGPQAKKIFKHFLLFFFRNGIIFSFLWISLRFFSFIIFSNIFRFVLFLKKYRYYRFVQFHSVTFFIPWFEYQTKANDFVDHRDQWPAKPLNKSGCMKTTTISPIQ
jgi:hypothetical protein